MPTLPVLLLAAFLAAPAPATPAAPPSDTLRLPGLDGPVEILRDPWGVAHIYAGTEHDLFFAQGWNVARDRLFQLEVWRRQATGTLAEVVGPEAVERDVGARLLRFRGDMEVELGHYHPRGAAIIGAFVEGINAWIARTEEDPSLLPVELEMLGMRPGRWTPEVVVSRHNGLFRNATDEPLYLRALEILGRDELLAIEDFEPGTPRLEVPDGLDTDVPEEVFRLYRAHRAPVRFRPDDVAPAYRAPGGDDARDPSPGAADTRASLAVDPWRLDRPRLLAVEDAGSNNWVVAGERTATRRPFMANDPHRALQVPSLRYFVHLVGPGWNVIGGGEPALPGASIGHNEHGAWGLTIFATDQEDLYVYETHPDDPDLYRYGGGWERMRVEVDTIRVAGADPVVAELRFTRHGPVLHADPSRQRAWGLRAAWLEPGTAPYLPSLRIDQARTWEEFREACSWHRTPSENMVWADTSGTIGWQAVGIAPQRPNWDGILPVPGDGRYEWDGFIPGLALPHAVDPARGWLATANENNVPDGYPFTVGYLWSDKYRVNRLAEVLDSGRRLSLADMMALQHDEVSLPARQLTTLLRHLDVGDARVRRARDLLLGWDHVMDRDAVAPTIYREWMRRLLDSTYARILPPEAADLPIGNTTGAVERLLAPDARFGPDPLAARDALVRDALAEAVDELTRRLGRDMDGWVYGQEANKHVLIHHPLSDAVSPAWRARLDVGPHPRGGYSFTVNNTGGGLNQTSGASFRVIADVGNWDASVATNTPGQSGDPSAEGYRNLFLPWAEGRYFPLLYSRARVEEAAVERDLLTPR